VSDPPGLIGAQDALVANELLTALEDETAKEELITLFDPNGPNTFEPVTKEAVVAFAASELEVANELDNELLAKELLNA
jgi:hypothetical protein